MQRLYFLGKDVKPVKKRKGTKRQAPESPEKAKDTFEDGWIWNLSGVGRLSANELQAWADEGASILFSHFNDCLTYLSR